MLRKINPFADDKGTLGLGDLLGHTPPPPQGTSLAARAFLWGGTAAAALGAGLLGAGLVGGSDGGFGQQLAGLAQGAQAAGMGPTSTLMLGLVSGGLGLLLTRLERTSVDTARLIDEQPDLRPALEGLAARQRQLGTGLGALQQRAAVGQKELSQSLETMVAGGFQSLEMGVESRLARFEESLLERLDALQAGQPTEPLWRLAASLDRLGIEIERRIERRLDQHVDGLDERIAALAESARAVLAAAPRALEPLASASTALPAAPESLRAPVAAPVRKTLAAAAEPSPRALDLPVEPAPPARHPGDEPSLAAQLRSFPPGAVDEPEADVALFDLDAAALTDLYGRGVRGMHPRADDENGETEFDETRIDEDLTASLGILDGPDPFGSNAHSRSLGAPPKSGVDRRPEPPAALPAPRGSKGVPTARPVDLRDDRGGSRR